MTEDKCQANKALVERFFQAMNAGDVDAIVEAYAADGRLQTMGGTLISGTFDRDRIAASAGQIFDVFPGGLCFTILDMTAEGDRVAVEARGAGEHVSGQTYSNEYHFLFKFRDGKLLLLREYMDTERVTDVICGGHRPPFDD